MRGLYTRDLYLSDLYTKALFSWSKARSAEHSEFLMESSLSSTDVTPKACRRVRILVRFFKYLFGWMHRQAARLRLVGTRWLNGAHIASLHLLCFSSLQWLTQDFKYETFHDQWIPFNSVSEVPMREKGQKRLQARKESHWPQLAQDWLHASTHPRQYNYQKKTSSSQVLILAKKNGSG